jgi:hypothetical protein
LVEGVAAHSLADTWTGPLKGIGIKTSIAMDRTHVNVHTNVHFNLAAMNRHTCHSVKCVSQAQVILVFLKQDYVEMLLYKLE